jgi:5-methylcytosine-specific restriction protein A
MPTAYRACPTPGCPNTMVRQQPRCGDCTTAAEQRRGTARSRGYGRAHHTRFRAGVLKADPICTCPPQHPSHQGQACLTWSTVADHWPKSRRELEQSGEDPNDPAHGRGLCETCHNWNTSQHQRGGWNQS